MLRRVFRFIFLSAAIISIPFLPQTTAACGHDGFFLGAGYEQLFMVTPESQLGLGNTGRVTFGPGYGADLVFGYDFCGSRWGIQLPIEYSRLKLNGSEWVNYIGSSLEAIFRVAEWRNGLDFHLVGGIGGSYLSEGKVSNNTASAGFNVGVGPGIAYFFSRTEKLTAAIAAELPIRFQYFIGNHLSANGTSAIAFPLRLSLQLGF